jgi:hypothetical protein
LCASSKVVRPWVEYVAGRLASVEAHDYSYFQSDMSH